LKDKKIRQACCSFGEPSWGECVRDGTAKRLVAYPRDLPALDALDETTLGTRPTMSHVTTHRELENLLKAVSLRGPAASGEVTEYNRDAA
jgi:chromosome partitioning protein